MSSLVAMGKPVICTIHQPSEEVFAKFTHLLLLAKGGRVRNYHAMVYP